MSGNLGGEVQRARRDPSLAVLEGFHAVKHALRFGAEILLAVTPDPDELARLVDRLAPDLREVLPALADPLPREMFGRLARHPPRTGVIAVARRPAVDVAAALADPAPAPLVYLESARNPGNLGAAVRVAAAAGAAGVLTTGPNDPWDAAALRGAAGLHFALPVARVDALPASDRPLVAVDPGGEPAPPAVVPGRAVLAFGTERDGLRPETLARAKASVRIPMRAGVSSLNLATSVAVLLFGPALPEGVERE